MGPELPGGGHDHAGHDHGDGHEHGDHDDHEEHGHGDEHGGHGNDGGCSGHDHDGHDHKGHDHGAHDHASEHAGEATPLTVSSGTAPDKKKKEEKRNVALQAAYLHVLGDLLQSFAVLVAGLIIWFFPSPNVRVIDPIATLLF